MVSFRARSNNTPLDNGRGLQGRYLATCLGVSTTALSTLGSTAGSAGYRRQQQAPSAQAGQHAVHGSASAPRHAGGAGMQQLISVSLSNSGARLTASAVHGDGPEIGRLSANSITASSKPGRPVADKFQSGAGSGYPATAEGAGMALSCLAQSPASCLPATAPAWTAHRHPAQAALPREPKWRRSHRGLAYRRAVPSTGGGQRQIQPSSVFGSGGGAARGHRHPATRGLARDRRPGSVATAPGQIQCCRLPAAGGVLLRKGSLVHDQRGLIQQHGIRDPVSIHWLAWHR